MGSDRPKMQQHAEAMLAAAEELERQGQRVTAYAACKRAGIPRSNSTIYRQALGDRWRWAVLDRGWRVTKARSNGKRNGHRPAPASPGDDQAELRRSLATTGAIGPIEVMPAAEQAVAAIARWNGTPLNGREMGEDHVAGEIDVARVLVVALKIDRILADLSLSEALALLRALNVVRQANSAGI